MKPLTEVELKVLEPMFLDAAETGHFNIVSNFIEMGVDINALDENANSTALILASEVGNLEMAQLLVKAGADVNIVNVEKYTALMCVANQNPRERSESNPVIAKLLLENGARVDFEHCPGITVMELAREGFYGNPEVLGVIEAHFEALESQERNEIMSRTLSR